MTFTDTKPATPGAYFVRKNEDGTILVGEVFECEGRLFLILTFQDGPEPMPLDEVHEAGIVEFSARLVPVEEVELAYHEGYRDGDSMEDCYYGGSRAHRVVVGKGEV